MNWSSKRATVSFEELDQIRAMRQTYSCGRFTHPLDLLISIPLYVQLCCDARVVRRPQPSRCHTGWSRAKQGDVLRLYAAARQNQINSLIKL